MFDKSKLLADVVEGVEEEVVDTGCRVFALDSCKVVLPLAFFMTAYLG